MYDRLQKYTKLNAQDIELEEKKNEDINQCITEITISKLPILSYFTVFKKWKGEKIA